MEQEETSNEVSLGDKVVGVIELPTLDVSKYVGHMVNIEKVTEHEGNFGYYIKVQTAKLDTIEREKEGKKEEFDIKASKIFGLQTDKDGNIGWGEDTKLGIFLKKMKVSHYRDLPGQVVQVQKRTNNEGKEFLTFE